jgi:hypothetical protein
MLTRCAAQGRSEERAIEEGAAQGRAQGAEEESVENVRSLHGTGICAWRVGDRRAAAAVFHELLSPNRSDNKGARFNVAAVEVGKTSEEATG